MSILRSSRTLSGRYIGLAAGLLVLSALTAAPQPARADVLPPTSCASTADTAPCSGKSAGDACTFASGSKGNCTTLNCTTDAGQPGLQCVATGANPSGGCRAGAGTAGAPAGIGVALLLGLLLATRKHARA